MEGALKKKDFNYDWQFLRDFFSLAYLRHLVSWFAVVPIAIAALGELPDSVRIPLANGEELTVNFVLPFKWWLLWLSSLFYVIAWGLYTVFRPKFIHRYRDYAAYKTWQHSKRWIIWEWYYYLVKTAKPDDVDILTKKNLAKKCSVDAADSHASVRSTKDLEVYMPEKGSEETWFFFRHKGSVYRLALGPDTDNSDTMETELFWELYGALTSSGNLVRASIWILLFVAGILFLIVLGQNIWTVLRYIALH